MGTDYGFKRKGWTLSTYPFTLLLIIIWVTFIAGLVWLLEQAVARAPVSVDQPWWISDLPTTLLTIFAQGHGAITAMYLARLGISALQHPGTAPKSWAELFWLADRNWQGPFGLIVTFTGKARLGNTTLSSTFILFAITCLFALPTPIALSKTYQVRTVMVNGPANIETNSLVPETLTTFDQLSQRSAGAGAWGTGMPVAQIYNATTYIPVTDNREGALDDVVFAGQLGDKDANMAAIHMKGGCKVIDVPETDLPIDEIETTSMGSYVRWCRERLPNAHQWDKSYLTNAWNVNLTVHWCSTHNHSDKYWTLDPDAALVNSLVWFDVTDTTTHYNGFIECNNTFELGTANLVGLSGTFTAFQASSLYNKSALDDGLAFWHPLSAALSELTLVWNSSEISGERSIAILRMYGFEQTFDADADMYNWKMPTLAGFADRLWGGALHMGAAIGALSRRSGEVVRVIEHRAVSGRTRDKYFALATVGLLAGWAGMLVLCTLRMFRPTFAPSLDSYAAARLLVDVPFLVEEHCCGELEVNGNLRAGFKRVGDAEPDGATGHIASGGVGMLVRKREYSGRRKADEA